MDKIESDGCNLYLFWSSPNNTVGYSGDLITYNINVNGITYTSRDNMIKIPHEHRCDRLHINATIQATNECNMTSQKASFENIRGNESDSIPYESLNFSYPDASTSQNTLSETSDVSCISSTQLPVVTYTQPIIIALICSIFFNIIGTGAVIVIAIMFGVRKFMHYKVCTN